MTDAVIVSAARTPIGRANKGSLVDVDAFELARVALGAAIERVRRRHRRHRRPRAGRVAAGRRRDRPLHRHHPRARRSVPGLADNRHCAAGLERRADRGRRHPGRHGPASSWPAAPRASARCPRRSSRSPPRPATTSRGCRPATRETPDAPGLRHVDHRRREHRPAGRPDPRRPRRVGGLQSHASACESIDNGCFEAEIVPGRGARRRRRHSALHHRRAPPPRHHRRDARRAPAAAPRARRARPITAGNSAGLNDAAAAVVLASSDYAAAHGLHAAGPHPLVGRRSASTPAAHRHGAPSTPSRRPSPGPG